jgi:DME family drug/metabolite transporter
MLKDAKGYFFVILGATFLGTMGVLGKLAYFYEPEPLTVVTFRGLIASAILFMIIGIFNRSYLKIRIKDIPFFCLYGFMSVTLAFILFFYAIKFINVAVATILVYTFPALIVLFSTVILKERFTKHKLIALLITFLGSALVAQVYNVSNLRLNLKGILCSLGCAVAASLYSIFGKLSLRKYNSWTVVTYALGFGTLFLLLFRGPQPLLYARYPAMGWILLFTLAIVPTVLGYSSYTRGLNYLEAGRAGIMATWEIVVASFLAFIVLSEKLRVPQILGALLIFWGIVIIRKKNKD